VALGAAAAVRLLLWAVDGRLAVAGLVVLAVPLVWHLRPVTHDIAAAQRLEDEVRRPLGQWLEDTSSPENSVMLEPIGYIGYYSRHRVIDVIGLVSPEVIPCYRPDVPNPLACVVERSHPSWLVLRPDERQALDPQAGAPREGGSGLLRGEYQWVHSVPDAATAPAFEIYKRRGLFDGKD
jgi:hypothetical protein